MKADGVTITWVSDEEALDHRDRTGFIHTTQYGRGVPIYPNEVGAIAIDAGKPRVVLRGLWEVPCRIVERIFVVEPT